MSRRGGHFGQRDPAAAVPLGLEEPRPRRPVPRCRRGGLPPPGPNFSAQLSSFRLPGGERGGRPRTAPPAPLLPFGGRHPADDAGYLLRGGGTETDRGRESDAALGFGEGVLFCVLSLLWLLLFFPPPQGEGRREALGQE